jgi:hypothetical protein
MSRFRTVELLPNFRLLLGMGAVVALLAAAVVWNPPVALGTAMGVLALVVGLSFPTPQHFFLAALGALLTGYAFLGRGFAYLPAPPVLVGEIVLTLGLLAALIGGKIRLAFRSPLSWLLLAFAVYGALRTIPYIRADGLHAFRDAVTWGYGAFAILVAAFVLQLGCFGRVVEAYGRWIAWLVLWLPVGILVQNLARDRLPLVSNVPPVTLLGLNPGDVLVNLAGVGGFLILRLHWPANGGHRRRPPLKECVMWAAWLSAAAMAGAANRGGFLAIALALAFVVFMRPASQWGKLVLLTTLLAAAFYAFNLSLNLGGPRDISIPQFTASVKSLYGDAPANSTLEANRRWRLEWWAKIIGYTFGGEYFWKGKGFGVNLADDDGFQVTPDHSLRSPHNSHMTILARMGVPGLLLWALLQGSFALGLLRAHFRARRARQEWWARVNLWILAYWTAFMVNAMFSVFLEGPQGGIWFWCLFGFGIAALETQKRERRAWAIEQRGASLFIP